MRYRDADHVDTGSFYARRAELGKLYRFLGYAGILMAWYRQAEPAKLAELLIVLVVVWLMAWYRVVGALWRSSVVGAILLCAVLLSMHHLQEHHQADALMAASP
jgi:hypothetical protein